MAFLVRTTRRSGFFCSVVFSLTALSSLRFYGYTCGFACRCTLYGFVTPISATYHVFSVAYSIRCPGSCAKSNIFSRCMSIVIFGQTYHNTHMWHNASRNRRKHELSDYCRCIGRPDRRPSPGSSIH